MPDDMKKLREEIEFWKKRLEEVPSIGVTFFSSDNTLDTILAALRAVEALPKTADGAYAIPGITEVYYENYYGFLDEEFSFHPNSRTATLKHSTEDRRVKAGDCYSTAALASQPAPKVKA